MITVSYIYNLIPFLCSVIIINYEDYYVNLSHLSLSMKPGGKLYNIAAEIGIYTLMDFKVKYPRKRIMAVSVSVSTTFALFVFE